MFRLSIDLSEHLERGGTVIVPTRQRSHAVSLAYAAALLEGDARVWASPKVLVPAAWLRRECERRAERAPAEWPRLLGPAEEWWLWRQAAGEAAREAAGQNPFLSIEPLAQALRRASERAAEWDIALARAPLESEPGLLFEARRIFTARCRDLGAASVGALIARLEPVGATEAPRLRGFDAVPRALARLAHHAGTAAAAREAGTRVSPRGVRTADGEAQLEAIAAWCRERLRASPEARLLVMLPGPAAARERLADLIGGCLDAGAVLAGRGDGRTLAGIEGGEPLASQSLLAQALLSLTILAGGALEIESIGHWLTSPWWGGIGAAPRAALAQFLRERAGASSSLRELLGALQLAPGELKVAARELEALARRAAGLLGEGSASPRRWSERFDAALTALSWPGTLPPEGAAQQTRLRWRELLEEFGELAACAGSLTREVALAELRALAAHTAYRPADEDLAVTISPMLADPVVTYDGIWAAGLTADVFPMPAAPDPFLPPEAQLTAGMPEASAAGRRAQARSLLDAWRRSAPELVLSLPAREKDLGLLPSPALEGLALTDEAPASLWLPLTLHREGCTEGREDARGAAFTSPAPLPSGTRAVTLQNECAFRAYAELRLGAVAPEHAEPGVPMDQRGLLLHAALQLLWERLRDSATLGSLEEGALDALIEDCVARGAEVLQVEVRGRRRRARRVPDGQFDLFSVLSPALTRECVRARRLIRRLCDLERTRTAFAVEATEHTTELALAGARVRMRLDRVDSVASGRVVLDYKSGRREAPDWYGERPTYPQLLAYLAALGADVVGLATVNLSAREVRFTGVAASGDVLPKVKAIPAVTGAAAGDWSAQRQVWVALIERLIRDFLAGEARVDPVPGACDYCHLTDLCRIGAHLAPELHAVTDEADE
ncbi:MAG TPA: PD-(D/E)XK nuclease family protein [Steroidobacteraceae bacterium]|nr:PD-(D/E)XK nuclease family protein [Steroidobacteraceae bacterium]